MASVNSEDAPVRPSIQDEIDQLKKAVERQQEEISNIYGRLSSHDSRITGLSDEIGR